ncbi:MAG: hypothetical protein IJU83_02335 [Clostridia bacterium]|nr:hypothetical protein [Clostridia bacterium]
MVDLLSLLQDTGAYRTVKEDKAAGKLSHAYLIVSADKENSGEFLKLFAKLIVGGDARAEKLIEEGVHPDVLTFPRNGDAVLKEDVSAIIEETFLKPVEGDIKLFLIDNGESMNASSQNKLLKTLEEPPRGVHILIAATSEYPLLSTVKSRVKKLNIPPFTEEKLFAALSPYCPDEERLKKAVACGDGTVSAALKLYGDDDFSQTVDAAADVFVEMRSSKDVPAFSARIAGLKDGAEGFISVLGLINRDMLLYFNGEENAVFDKSLLERVKKAEGFTAGALVYAADAITDARKRLAANVNPQAVIERLLFAILEGKHKWQKL